MTESADHPYLPAAQRPELSSHVPLRSAQRTRRLDAYSSSLLAPDRLTPAVYDSLLTAMRISQTYDNIFYVAGALTGMTETVKKRYGLVSELLAEYTEPGASAFGYAPHLHGTDPVKHPDVTPREVRDIDYMFAAIIPDYHINFLHPTAHGSAIEEGWAEERGIPAVYLAPQGAPLSRLVLGMENIVEFVRYENFETDGLASLRTFLDGVARERLGQLS